MLITGLERRSFHFTPFRSILSYLQINSNYLRQLKFSIRLCFNGLVFVCLFVFGCCLGVPESAVQILCCHNSPEFTGVTPAVNCCFSLYCSLLLFKCCCLVFGDVYYQNIKTVPVQKSLH